MVIRETKRMVTIKDLHDVAEANKGLPVVAIVDGQEVEVSRQFYVEDGICYYFLKRNEYADEQPSKGSDIVFDIEMEAEDECWNDTGWGARNTYGDCQVKIADGMSEMCLDDAIVYNIKEIIGIDDGKIYLTCEYEATYQ